MAKRKKNVPKDETKQDKFKRIVEPRVRKALKAIRLIGNCANPTYGYTDEQISTIITSLLSHVNGVQEIYSRKGKITDTFDLD